MNRYGTTWIDLEEIVAIAREGPGYRVFLKGQSCSILLNEVDGKAVEEDVAAWVEGKNRLSIYYADIEAKHLEERYGVDWRKRLTAEL